MVVSLAIIFLTFSKVAIAQKPALQLSLPIDCQPRKTCFIQNYVDIDPSKAVRDYANEQAIYVAYSGKSDPKMGGSKVFIMGKYS